MGGDGLSVESGADHFVLHVDEFEGKEGGIFVEEEAEEDFVAFPEGKGKGRRSEVGVISSIILCFVIQASSPSSSMLMSGSPRHSVAVKRCMYSFGQVSESNFVEIASNIATGKPTGCMFTKNCQDNFLAIAPTGDVMPCGRFCDNDLLQYSYGNLHREPLADILPRIKETETYKRAEYIAATGCKDCRWYHICHGGCLHDGFLASSDFRHKTFLAQLNVFLKVLSSPKGCLCPAYKKIFAHIEHRLQENNMIDQN